MSLTFIVDGKTVTGSNKTFTLSDPGGCESASIDSPGGYPRPGSKVLILDGTQPLYLGLVEEPGTQQKFGENTPSSIGSTGLVALCSNPRIAQIFIDRDLSRWRQSSLTRQQVLLAASCSDTQEISATFDVTYGPALTMKHDDISGTFPRCEAWYDAGPNCYLGRLAFAHAMTNPEASLGVFEIYSTPDEVTFTLIDTGIVSATQETKDLTVPSNARCFTIVSAYTANTGLAPGTDRLQALYNLAVIGNHGLPIEGSVSTSENTLAIRIGKIVEYALKCSKLGGTILCETGPPVFDLKYPDLVSPRQIIDDGLKLSGFHFGVWPGPVTDPYSPLQLFQAPPKRATAIVNYNDCTEPDITEKLTGMNSRAKVSYQLGDKSESLIVTRQHPRLVTGEGGTIDVDVGPVGSVTRAQTYGLFALATDQNQSKAAGSLTLPALVVTEGGGRKPSHHLRPGVDRLRIVNLPNTTKFLGDDVERGDTFRIARLTVTEQDGGIKTVAELDQGADLIEVLQAKFTASDPTGLLGG